jgi:preprotein translocase subunit SecD
MNSRRGLCVLALALTLGGCALFQPSQPGANSAPPKRVTLRFFLAESDPQEGYRQMTDEQGQPLFVAPKVLLTERDVRKAAVYHGPQRRLIRLEFEPLAAARLEQATADHIGGRLAVFVDDKLVMSPMLRAPLAEGKVLLDGGFSPARAEEIAQSLNRPRTMTESNP